MERLKDIFSTYGLWGIFLGLITVIIKPNTHINIMTGKNINPKLSSTILDILVSKKLK